MRSFHYLSQAHQSHHLPLPPVASAMNSFRSLPPILAILLIFTSCASKKVNPATLAQTTADTPSSLATSTKPTVVKPNFSSRGKAAYISTAWLEKYHLENAIIKSIAFAKVLCVPGLPCGTPGHLLRRCEYGIAGCRLLTYREACSNDLDCAESAMEVSQLSHTYDWSTFHTSSSEDTIYELTSVSAHSLSGPWSPSRMVANAGDYLNRMGLGSVCNAFSLFPSYYQSTLNSFVFTETR